MIDIKNLLDLASLPSQMRIQSSIGDATAGIVEAIAKQVQQQSPLSLKSASAKADKDLLALYEAECTVFGETTDRAGYETFKAQYKA